MTYVAVLCFGNRVFTSMEMSEFRPEIAVPIPQKLTLGKLDPVPEEVKFIDLVFEFSGMIREDFGKTYLEYDFAGWRDRNSAKKEVLEDEQG